MLDIHVTLKQEEIVQLVEAWQSYHLLEQHGIWKGSIFMSEMQPSGTMLPISGLPLIFHQADQDAIQAQHRYLVLLVAELSLISLGVLASLLASTLPSVGPVTINHLKFMIPIADIVAVGVIAAAMTIRIGRTVTHLEIYWYEARAVAESVKSLVWRYAVGGHPVGLDLGVDANALYRQRLGDCLNEVPTYGKIIRPMLSQTSVTSIPTQVGSGVDNMTITQSMFDLRQNSLLIREGAYRVDRVIDQYRWYNRQHNENRRWSLFFYWFLLLIQAVAICLVMFHALGILTLNLQPLALTVVTGTIAWTQARRYHDLSGVYEVTRKEIEFVRLSLEAIIANRELSEEEWAAFVFGTEEVFSREHRLWRAIRS